MTNKRNKPRLYLGFWKSGDPGDPYHVGLLLTPARPEPLSQTSTVFHATRDMGNKDGQGPVFMYWTFGTKRTNPRTRNLLGVVFLGKMKNVEADDIKNALDSVEIPPPMLADDVVAEVKPEDWDCSNWASEAMDILADKKIIEIPGTGKEVFLKGLEFVDSKPAPQNGRLATCTPDGTVIEGEIFDLVPT